MIRLSLILVLSVAVFFIMVGGQAADSLVICVKPGCRHAFRSEANKAPLWDAMFKGAVDGIMQPDEPFFPPPICTPPVIPFINISGIVWKGGIGAIGGAWHRDRQVMCPACKTVFIPEN